MGPLERGTSRTERARPAKAQRQSQEETERKKGCVGRIADLNSCRLAVERHQLIGCVSRAASARKSSSTSQPSVRMRRSR